MYRVLLKEALRTIGSSVTKGGKTKRMKASGARVEGRGWPRRGAADTDS